jgi:hypothetical protein
MVLNSDGNMVIYVLLVDEPIPMWRPVKALRISDDVFEIIKQEVPEGEVWQFEVGTRVRVGERSSEGGGYLAAEELA